MVLCKDQGLVSSLALKEERGGSRVPAGSSSGCSHKRGWHMERSVLWHPHGRGSLWLLYPEEQEGILRCLEQPNRTWTLDLALHITVKLLSCPSLGTEWPHFSLGAQWHSREETVINPMERKDKAPHPTPKASPPSGHNMEGAQGRGMVTAAWFSTQLILSWKAWRSPLASSLSPWCLTKLSTMAVCSKASTALPRASWLLLLICIQRISSTV